MREFNPTIHIKARHGEPLEALGPASNSEKENLSQTKWKVKILKAVLRLLHERLSIHMSICTQLNIHTLYTHRLTHAHTKAKSLVGYEILGAASVLLRTETRAVSDKGPETRKWWVTQTTL